MARCYSRLSLTSAEMSPSSDHHRVSVDGGACEQQDTGLDWTVDSVTRDP